MSKLRMTKLSSNWDVRLLFFKFIYVDWECLCVADRMLMAFMSLLQMVKQLPFMYWRSNRSRATYRNCFTLKLHTYLLPADVTHLLILTRLVLFNQFSNLKFSFSDELQSNMCKYIFLVLFNQLAQYCLRFSTNDKWADLLSSYGCETCKWNASILH